MLFSHIPLRVQGDRLSRESPIITMYIYIYCPSEPSHFRNHKAQNEKKCLYLKLLHINTFHFFSPLHFRTLNHCELEELSRYSDSPWAGRSGDRIPEGGPPSLLYNVYRVFTGSEAAGAWRWPPTPSSADVKEKVELYIYSPLVPSWPVIG